MKKIKIHKEGYGIVAVLFLIIATLNVFVYYETPNRTLFIINLIITCLAFSYVVFFFRNPSRVVEVDDNNMIIAPADGRVCVIEPTEEWEYFEGRKMIQVSIFMSLFSVHANWFPISGKVLYTKHHKGRHIAAYLPKSSSENERSTTVIECANGEKILVRQVAGALARRIVTYAAPGHECTINEHLGFIKFGSRVDLFLPADSKIFVELGESTKGNETILARL
ncbi:MAG: phosphatidylserine decarboxylase family protein [Paludibacteraceae bacterium]|nr:phosphatidylserine decarboxylase family protein [Paludibacteraceae bacterium]